MKCFILCCLFILVLGQGCSFTDPDTGYFYDLSALGGQIFSAESTGGFGGPFKYRVTLCGNGIERCGETASVSGFCQHDARFEQLSWNIGTYEAGSINIDEDHRIVLSYTGGDPVNGGGNQRAGRIIVRCNPTATPPSNFSANAPPPTNIQGYEFTFDSAEACPKPKPPDCTFLDPVTGYFYDLSPLKGRKYGAHDGGWLFNVSICTSSFNCGGSIHSGYCQRYMNDPTVSFSIGSFLEIDSPKPDQVVLHYLNGDVANGEPRSGEVIVTCDPEAHQPRNFKANSPRDVDGFRFTFDSADACKEPSPESCFFLDTATQKFYDLTPLKGAIFQAVAGQWSFNFSICGDPMSCGQADKSGFCQIDSLTPSNQYSIGSYAGMKFQQPNQISLFYNHGDTVQGQYRSGHVVVSCDPEAKQPMNFQATIPTRPDGYQVSFDSAEACGKPKPCTYKDPNTGDNYDLSSLSGRVFQVVGGTWTYTFSLCHNLLPCPSQKNPAGFCQIGTQDPYQQFSIGTFAGIEVPKPGLVILHYVDGEGGRSGHAEVICDPSATTPRNFRADFPTTPDGYRVYFDSDLACPSKW